MNGKQHHAASANDQAAAVRWHDHSYTIEEAIGLAVKTQRQGDAAAAAELYRLIIKEAPDRAECHGNLGTALTALGQLDEAVASCGKAIALKPDFIAFYHSRAAALQALKRYEEALSDYDKSTALMPGYATAHYERAKILAELGRYAEALESYDRAIAIKPDYALAYAGRALALNKLQRCEEALANWDKAINLDPGRAAFHKNRSLVLIELGRNEEAIAGLDQAIALKHDFPGAWNNRGIALHASQRYEEALASYDKAVALKPDYADAWNNRGITLHLLKRFKDSLASYDKALALKTDYADAWNNRGIVLRDMGRMQEAEEMLTRAAALKPDFINPLFSLANIRRYKSIDHPDVKALQALLKNSPTLADRDYLYFALGKIYDECNYYDEAFEYYRQGNRILSEAAGYNPQETVEYTNSTIAVFNKDFLAQAFPFASADRSPVFIVGMPRSGTTLMASILSNHPSVGTAGELPTLAEFTRRVQQLSPYPQAVQNLQPGIARQLIDMYRMRLRRDISSDKIYVIDKHPLNFRRLGLIAMLFPKAHIIHCLRHPLDTGLSNYFQRFTLDFGYSFDLGNIGQYYGEYARLMQHWQKALPFKLLEIRYEDMTADTGTAARRMLDFLELEWDERCLSPHTNPNPVETASNWQVRQPVYKKSVARWQHYEKQLAPMKEALKRAGVPILS